MSYASVMDGVAMAFEGVGAAVLVGGAVWAASRAYTAWRTVDPATAFTVLRRSFGSTLLLGLEVLVAADLIRTVAVAPTLENVAVLGLIVVIRTFLSFSLQVEIDGVTPWKRALLGRGESAPSVALAPSGASAASVASAVSGVSGVSVADVDPPAGFVGKHEGPG